METLLIPRLVLPYLDKCVIHATVLNTRAEAYHDMLEVLIYLIGVFSYYLIFFSMSTMSFNSFSVNF